MNELTYGSTRRKTTELAFLSRKRDEVEKKAIRKVVASHCFSTKRHLVEINKTNRTVKTRNYFSRFPILLRLEGHRSKFVPFIHTSLKTDVPIRLTWHILNY